MAYQRTAITGRHDPPQETGEIHDAPSRSDSLAGCVHILRVHQRQVCTEQSNRLRYDLALPGLARRRQEVGCVNDNLQLRIVNFIQEPARVSCITDDVARFRLDAERNAMTLSKFADCTLYLVRQGHTFKKQVVLIDEFYQENKLPKVSIIINDVKMKAGYGYYGYGRYGYGYGYGYGSYYEEETAPKSALEKMLGSLNLKNLFGKK